MRKRKLFRFKKMGRKTAAGLKSDYYIFGLGNIGARYAHTRHNAGFDVLDILAQKNHVVFNASGYKSVCAQVSVAGKKVLLVKPQTYMNNSGQCVNLFIKKHRIPLDNIIVVYDDIDLKQGALRIRKGGSAGTHNGLRSIIYHLQQDDFKRIRIGVGRPQNGESLIDFVIGHYPKADLAHMFDVYTKAGLAALDIVRNGIASAQSQFNSKGV